MPYDTSPPKAVQLACIGNEWAALLADAAGHGLVDPAGAASAQARFAMGLLTTDGLQSEARTLLAAGPAAGTALDAIAAAYAPDDVIELRALDPITRGAVSLCDRLGDPNGRAALEAFIRAHIGQRNIYVGVNARLDTLAGSTGVFKDGKLELPSAKDVKARRAVVLDLDMKDAPSTDTDWSRTVAALVADTDPLLVLNSGNGVHVWLDVEPLSGADVAASAGLLASAMARLGADNMADPARIVRLPCTPNLPDATKRKRGAVVRLAAPVPDHKPKPRALRQTPPTVTRLCADLEGMAIRQALPGRGGAVASAGASRVAVGGGAKTPWAAPSADLLRAAVDAIPNDAGHFDDRNDWSNLGHAIKGAAMAGGCEPEGREAWLAFCARWDGPNDPDAAERFWDGVAAPHVGWGAIMRALETANPAEAARLKTAVAQAAFAQAAADTRAVILASPFAPVTPVAATQLAPRRWLYGRTALAGFLAYLVAPGGVGKSAFALAEAVAMTSGKELLPGEAPVRPLRVWMHNAEDDLPEMQRRLAATLQHFGLTYADLNENLFMTSGRDLKLQLARMGKNGPEIVPGVVDALVERAVAAKLDVIFLDPLGALHTLPENSNEAANLLSGALREIAHRADVAVIVLHHTGKAAATDMDAAGAGASRGASAFVDAARVVRQVVRMSDREAARYGIAEADRRDYLRIENGKSNLARAEGGRWLRMVDVGLGNGMGLWPLGDRVGVVERWLPPQSLSGTASDLLAVQVAIAAAPTPPRVSPKSPDWAGYVVAAALGLNIGLPGVPAKDRTADEAAGYARVRGLLDGWFRDGSLIRLTVRDPKARHEVDVVGIGKPAMLSDDTDAPDTDGDE